MEGSERDGWEGGTEWREWRVRERWFLDSESPKRAPWEISKIVGVKKTSCAIRMENNRRMKEKRFGFRCVEHADDINRSRLELAPARHSCVWSGGFKDER